MDINIKYDINDISAQIAEDVKKTMAKALALEVKQLHDTFKVGAEMLINELTRLLEIKDNRQRERIKHVVTRNLDKWTKGGGIV